MAAPSAIVSLRRRWIALAVWSLFLLALPAPTGGVLFGAEIDFPPHPRLMYTAEEIEAWKNDPARKKELDRAVNAADALLKKKLYVPKEGGQWIFYYVCPECSGRLQAKSRTEHYCKKCDVTYDETWKPKSDKEDVLAAYRTKLNNILNRNIRTLGLAWALTGDDTYAEHARPALLELARVYPTLTRHNRWGKRGIWAAYGGRRYCQALTEGIGAIDVAKGWDLMANSEVFSAKDRRIIEQDFLGRTAREMQRYQFFVDPSGRNNHITWHNATYASVGTAVGDADLVYDAVHGKHGLLFQLQHSVTSDGLWCEGTMAYHSYALQAVVQTVDAVEPLGWEFRDNERLKSLFLGPLRMAYPDGSLPVFNDSDPANLNGWKWAFTWAWKYFGDPLFAAQAGIDVDGAPEIMQPESAALTDAGYVTLRRGAGKDALCAMIDFGSRSASHDHADKLGIVLWGLGRELYLDPGRINYSAPEWKTWSKQTVAHNTVVLDGRSMGYAPGEILFFDANDRCAAALTRNAGAYRGADMRRFLLLTDRFLVDAFSVRNRGETSMDWIIHSRGVPEHALDMLSCDEPLGSDEGYQHLSELKEANGTEHAVFRFRQGKGEKAPLLAVHCVDDEDSMFFTGTGIGYNTRDRVPFLMRRRTAARTVFLSVHDLSGTGAAVTDVDVVAVTSGGELLPKTEATGLLVSTSTGKFLIGLRFSDADRIERDRKRDAAAVVAGRDFDRMLYLPLE